MRTLQKQLSGGLPVGLEKSVHECELASKVLHLLG